MQFRRIWRAGVAVAFLAMSGSLFAAEKSLATQPSRESVEFFEKEIRPLLSKRCYECHSGTKPKGNLRLTSRQEILTGGSSGPAAVPGKPRDSLLIEAIEHAGGFDMPPKGKMPETEIAKITKWVELGLPWPGEQEFPVPKTSSAAADQYVISEVQRKHWAFQPVRVAAVPPVSDNAWPVGDIDRFVLAGLDKQRLRPNPSADKRTLLRRVTLDLTGLPPTPEEIRDFLADSSPVAYARVVDRLLASPHYGERWGRHWLDVARYADTAGDGADYPVREAYKYRNWVIDAFNQDKPYNQFLHEQIAGDILAQSAPRERYAELIIATGFLASTKRYGYNTNDDFRHLDISDTIDVVGKSVLGLSLGCARCHDHKYDPVSAADYYAMYGIFDSSQYSFPGGEEHKKPAFLVPLVPPAELKVLDAKWKQDIGQAKKELDNRKDEWLSYLKQNTQSLGGFDLAFETQQLNSNLNELYPSSTVVQVLAAAQSPFTNAYLPGTRGVRMPRTETTGELFRQSWTPAWDNQRLLHVNLDFRPAAENPRDKLVGTFHIQLGHDTRKSPMLEIAATLDEFSVTDAGTYQAIRKLQPGTWYNLQLTIDLQEKTYSGSIGTPGDITAFSGKKFHDKWDGVVDTIRFDGAGHKPGPRMITDVDNIALTDKPLPPVSKETVWSKGDSLTDAAKQQRARNAEIAEKSHQLEAKVVAARAHHRQVEATPPYEVAYGVSEAPAVRKPHNVRIQLRGEPTKLGTEVPRRFLQILGGDKLPEKESSSGRLQLADWLTRPDNPLTTRVIVNRLWHYHFGRGLAPLPSDFGLRGEPPSHPELLDFLANRLMLNSWSLKAMHREILLSRTYQQSSLDQPEALKVDPDNVWLWKFSRRRMDAESIRDGMLAVAGTLDTTRGEGFAFPELHQWNFTIHNQFRMVQDSRQRSIYLLAQRLTRQPFLSLFDGADPSNSTDNRPETTTPTQALYLMNSPFVHEQSKEFAKRILAKKQSERESIPLAIELACGTAATAEDITLAQTFLAHYRNKLSAARVPAKEQELQAWAAYSQALLTSNGFLYVD